MDLKKFHTRYLYKNGTKDNTKIGVEQVKLQWLQINFIVIGYLWQF